MARLFGKQLAKNENQISEPCAVVITTRQSLARGWLKRLNLLQQAETPPRIGGNKMKNRRRK